MKKNMHYLLIAMLTLVLSFCIGSISADAANVRTGTLGTNGGVQWSYDEDTRTLTLTGEDDGLGTSTGSYGWIRTICMDVEKIVLQDFTPVGSVRNLFNCLVYLKTVEVNNVDTSKVTDMSYMFYECNALTTLDVSGFDTSNVTDMSHMFYRCNALTTLDVSGFDTSNVTNMYCMFYNCRSLKTLDVGDFDTSNVTDMSWMFYDCAGLKTLDVSKFDTSKVTNMGRMFSGCRALTLLDVSKFDTSKVIYMEGMFSGCVLLTTLDVSKFDTSKVTGMGGMFNSCNALTTLDVRGFDTSNVKIMTDMFNGCKLLTVLDVSGFDTSNVTNMYSMFKSCSSLTSLDMTQFETSNVKNMAQMFANCYKVESLDVSGFNTAKVTDMHGMFQACSGITELDLSNFDTVKATDAQDMLSGLNSLEMLRTPKAMASGQVIALPETLRDFAGKKVSEFNNSLCGTTLYKYLVELNAEKAQIPVDSKLQLKIKVNGVEQGVTDNTNYQWTSSAAKVATVSDKGIVTAVSPGTVTITCTRENRNTATYQLEIAEKLAIKSQPQSATVTEGESVTFKVTAAGGGLKYQWQFRTSDAAAWTNSGMTGAKTNSITVQGTMARNGYQYRCVVTDCMGNKVNSIGATLQVIKKLAITGQPASKSVTEGESATFKVTATGTGLTYQWQFKTANATTWVNSGMTGAKTNSINVQGTAARNGYQYRCVVTDVSGKQLTSKGATLTVARKLAITGQPAGKSITEGESAVFKVTATGTGLTYQWQFRKSSADSWINSGMTGAKTNSITVQGTMARNGYQYRCVVTDVAGKKLTSAGATLTVSVKFEIIGQPESKSVTEGESATFKVKATGTGLTYQWQFRKSAVDSWTNSGMAGSKTNSITVQGTMARNGYQYRCVITDSKGKKLTSDGATLTVKEKLAIAVHPVSQTVAEGTYVTFDVKAAGTDLSYRWQYREPWAIEWSAYTGAGASTSSITLEGCRVYDAYQYRCIVMDGEGNTIISNKATLTVNRKIVIDKQPSSMMSHVDRTVNFTIWADGDEISYQWQFCKPGETEWKNSGMPGAQTDTLSIEVIESRDRYRYRCIITDMYGQKEISEVAVLVVIR